MADDRNTISIYPHAEGPLDWEMVDKFTERFGDGTEAVDNRNQALLEAMHWYLLIHDRLDGLEEFRTGSLRERRMLLQNALIAYLND